MARTLELPTQESLVPRLEATRGGLEDFAAAHVGDPLLWCQLPRLLTDLQNHMASPHAVPSFPSKRKLQGWAERLGVREPPAWLTDNCLASEDCMFLASTTNMARAQAGLHARFAPVRPAVAPPASIEAMRAGLARAVELADELIAYARDRRLELPEQLGPLHRELIRTAAALVHCEALVAAECPRVVVVSSGGAPRVRALIHAARQAGVPTVCIPHAPQLTDIRRSGDLPWDYAGLRGPAEIAYLAEQGVDAERLDVIGNATVGGGAPPILDPERAPAFAPSKEWVSPVGPLVELVHDALGDRVAVSCHPASQGNGEGVAFPTGWQVWEGRTYDLLRTGPPVVLQQSSGVALEALHLGIPVIQLHIPGRPTVFPLIREPFCRFCTTSGELAAAVAEAREMAVDDARRAELIAWSREWSSPVGDDADEQAAQLVQRAAVEGPGGAIWDSWNPAQ